MGYIIAPTLRIASIDWSLSRPGQVNSSPFTGTRTAVTNPWHGKWSASVELAPIVGKANAAPILAFLASCKGQLATFKLPASEGAQNANSGVTLPLSHPAGSTVVFLTGVATPLVAGQHMTINDQLLRVTAVDSDGAVFFEPRLREAANAGTAVETSRPYALVHMVASSVDHNVGPGQQYRIAFDVVEAVRESTISDHALALDFKAQRYHVNGARKALLSSVPGYAFARSGSQGAANATGDVFFFGANVPAINSAGFHCFQSVTNLVFPSSIGGGLADPAGGTGAASFSTEQNASFTAAINTTYTIGTICKAEANGWLRVYLRDGANANQINVYFNLTTGAVGSTAIIGTSFSFVGAPTITPLGNGFYRCVFRMRSTTATDLSLRLRSVPGDGTGAPDTGSIILYHRQVVAGDFPNGGPIVVTTASSASIGASDLEVGATLPNGDFIAWVGVNLSGLPASTVDLFCYSTAGAGTSNERVRLTLSSAGTLVLDVRTGGVVQSTPSNLLSTVTASGGRVAFMVRRRNGVYSLAVKKADGTVTIGTNAAAGGSIPAVTAVEIGAFSGGTSQINARVESFHQRNGTFTDADATAILQAA